MAGEEHPNSEVESSQPVGTVDESAVSRPVIGYLSPVLCSDWLIDSAQAECNFCRLGGGGVGKGVKPKLLL